MLPVLQQSERQDCAHCANRINCWHPRLSDRAVLISRLVCRIQRSIDREDATQLLLSMVDNELARLATRAVRRTHLEFIDAKHDLRAKLIESILASYVMGECAHPLRFWFAWPFGQIVEYAYHYADHERRHAHLNVDDVTESSGNPTTAIDWLFEMSAEERAFLRAEDIL